ncbi:hypothetical protein IBX73_03440 [candidate division WOR-3 bacterium]|nr:hypothetical protein [candidate division WOR-3 bacterium]
MQKNTRRILLIVWIILIFALTGFPVLELPDVDHFPLDKLYHFVVFFIMGALAADLLKVRAYFLLGLGVVLLAECQQLIIPGRRFEPLDMVAGAVALVVSYILFKKMGERRDVQ